MTRVFDFESGDYMFESLLQPEKAQINSIFTWTVRASKVVHINVNTNTTSWPDATKILFNPLLPSVP